MSPSTEHPTEAQAEVDEATAILVRARGFIERGWCKYALALDAAGHAGERVWPTNPRAVAWCASGALIAAGLEHPSLLPTHPAIRRFSTAIGGRNLVSFNNDQETVEPVLAAFDRAIAAEREAI